MQISHNYIYKKSAISVYIPPHLNLFPTPDPDATHLGGHTGPSWAQWQQLPTS